MTIKYLLNYSFTCVFIKLALQIYQDKRHSSLVAELIILYQMTQKKNSPALNYVTKNF